MNQKLGRKAKRVLHKAILLHHKAVFLCPIRALIRWLKHIQQHSSNTSLQLGMYFNTRGQQCTVCPRTINNALRVAVKALRIHLINILPILVSLHSLQAGGATGMHINGVPEVTIEKMGQWSSDTFLIYIQDQLFHFLNNILSLMSNKFSMFTVNVPIQSLLY